MEKIEKKGITIIPAQEPRHAGQYKGSDITVYDLKTMPIKVIEAKDLAKYLRENSDEEESKGVEDGVEPQDDED